MQHYTNPETFDSLPTEVPQFLYNEMKKILYFAEAHGILIDNKVVVILSCS